MRSAGRKAERGEARFGVADARVQHRLPFGLGRDDFERLAHQPGDQRRRRGRKDEGAAAVDEEIGDDVRRAEQRAFAAERLAAGVEGDRSEEHTSELQSLMRISYDVY